METLATSKKEPFSKLYFTEFKTKTYFPITMEDVEKQSDYRFYFYKKNPLLNDIKKILETRSTKNTIDNKCIRLKISYSEGEKYFVDCNGVVLKNGKETFLLSDSELKRLEGQILNLNGVVDIWLEFDALEY
jgi:hypothetical protein